jgi:hypothetical protein
MNELNRVCVIGYVHQRLRQRHQRLGDIPSLWLTLLHFYQAFDIVIDFSIAARAFSMLTLAASIGLSMMLPLFYLFRVHDDRHVK